MTLTSFTFKFCIKMEYFIGCLTGRPTKCSNRLCLLNFIAQVNLWPLNHLFLWSFQMVCKYLVHNYDWDFMTNEQLDYKWLPVSRPKDPPPATFTARWKIRRGRKKPLRKYSVFKERVSYTPLRGIKWFND